MVLEHQAGHERPGAEDGALFLDTYHLLGEPAHTLLGLYTGPLGKVSEGETVEVASLRT